MPSHVWAFALPLLHLRINAQVVTLPFNLPPLLIYPHNLCYTHNLSLALIIYRLTHIFHLPYSTLSRRRAPPPPLCHLPLSGYATNYLLTVVFGGRKFATGDSLLLYLPGFFTKGPPLSNTTVDKPDYSAGVTLKPSFDNVKHILTLTPYNVNSSWNATYVMKVMLLTTFQLALPLSGIPYGANNKYDVGWNTVDGSHLYEHVLTVSPVGAMEFVRVVLTGRSPNAITGVNVSLALYGTTTTINNNATSITTTTTTPYSNLTIITTTISIRDPDHILLHTSHPIPLSGLFFLTLTTQATSKQEIKSH